MFSRYSKSSQAPRKKIHLEIGGLRSDVLPVRGLQGSASPDQELDSIELPGINSGLQHQCLIETWGHLETFKGEKIVLKATQSEYFFGEDMNMISNDNSSNRFSIRLLCKKPIYSTDLRIVLIDHETTNGLIVNNMAVSPRTKIPLKDADVVTLACDDSSESENLQPIGFAFHKPNIKSMHELYSIQGSLGGGMYGGVVKVKHNTSGGIFAMKIFHKPLLKPKDSFSVQLREVELLKSLSHPHVYPLLDVVSSKTEIGMVFDLAPFGDLKSIGFEGARLKRAQLQDLFSQLLLGTQYLHEKDIIHRDLKPANILVYSLNPMNIRVADLGLARRVANEKKTYTQKGTWAYMAPELRNDNRSKGYTKAIDIWSIGIILMESKLFKVPFQNPFETLEKNAIDKILDEEFKSTGKFDDLVRSLVVYEPELRLTAAEAVRHTFFDRKDVTLSIIKTV